MTASALPTWLFTAKTWQSLARGLAAAVFLFLLNAFVWSGVIYGREVVIGLSWLALCYVLSARCSVLGVLVPTCLGCVAWGLFIESQPVSDWLYYHEFAQGRWSAFFYSKSFVTVLYGAVFHWLLGSGWVTNYIASALTWTVGAAFVYAAPPPCVADRRQARFVCFALALCPTFLVFSPVLGSMGVFFLISAICAWLVSKHYHDRGRYSWMYSGGIGLAIGLLFLTRPHGALLLAVCVPVVVLMPRFPDVPRKNDWAAAGIVLAAFAAVLLTHGGLSYVYGYGFKVSSNQQGWLILLFGTSVPGRGMHNLDDVALVAQWDDRDVAAVNRRLREIVVTRITADVPAFVQFAFTKKMRGLYGRDPRLFLRAHGTSDRVDMLEAYVQTAAERVERGVYRWVFLLFLVLSAREIWRPSRLLVLGIIVLLFSLPHLLLETGYRYHMLMLPYFVVGVALLSYEWAGTAQRNLCRILQQSVAA